MNSAKSPGIFCALAARLQIAAKIAIFFMFLSLRTPQRAWLIPLIGVSNSKLHFYSPDYPFGAQ